MSGTAWRSISSISSFLFLLLIACSKPLPSLKKIDATAWQADKNGCSGNRAASLDALREQKKDFLGLSEMEIVEIFGKPDRNELYKRNQKFYYYFLQPAPECPAPAESPLKLAIRFNAMGLAKEISVE